MLFSNGINEVTITNKNIEQIIQYLLNLEFTNTATKDAYENFCLCIFLVGCFKYKILHEPVKITSRESPDFLLNELATNNEIGLEHTKATLESFKIAESELKKYPAGSMIELCHYSPFENISKQKSDIGIIQPKGRLHGEGWKGNQVEAEWTQVILNAIQSKTSLLNKDHFHKKQQNHLFIEDNSPVDFVKIESTAFNLLKQEHSKIQSTSKYVFDKIHIFSQCILVYDFFGKHLRMDLHKKELSL